MSKVRSAFRRERSDWDLSDTAPFDFSDELVEDETPKFNKLKVVVSGEMSDYSAGAPSNGVAVNTLVVADDDDSLLESSSSLGSPGLNMDPCDNCTKKREKIKHKRVMKRLILAALLYFLFMTGEIIGKHMQNIPHIAYFLNLIHYCIIELLFVVLTCAHLIQAAKHSLLAQKTVSEMMRDQDSAAHR